MKNLIWFLWKFLPRASVPSPCKIRGVRASFGYLTVSLILASVLAASPCIRADWVLTETSPSAVRWQSDSTFWSISYDIGAVTYFVVHDDSGQSVADGQDGVNTAYFMDAGGWSGVWAIVGTGLVNPAGGGGGGGGSTGLVSNSSLIVSNTVSDVGSLHTWMGYSALALFIVGLFIAICLMLGRGFKTKAGGRGRRY